MTDAPASTMPPPSPSPPPPPAPPAPPHAGPPAQPPLWPSPHVPVPLRVLAGVLLVGVLALVIGLPRRAGINLPVIAVTLVVAVAVPLWRRRDLGDRLLLVLAVTLCAVAALRDSTWLVTLCVLAALGLLAFVVVGARRWPSTLLAAPFSVVLGVLGLVWAVRGAPRPRRLTAVWPWVRGGALGLVAAGVVGALLTSADPDFARVVHALVPTFEIRSLPARAVVAGLCTLVALTVAYAGQVPSQFDRLTVRGRRRPAAEWAVPLALVDVVLLAFVAVQASLLFGGTEIVATTDLTYAERARQGFGQLVGVTLLTVALLAWAGRRARPDGRHRLLVAGLGGGLVALTLVVVASALRRMWLYEQAYGWTVLRVNVAAFEMWLAVVLVLVSAGWLLRRTAASARLVVASAGIGMLVLAVIGPDALVARLDVERFTATGKVDVEYLRQLAAESVPALDRLPEPQRSCTLVEQPLQTDPWYGWNSARSRAVSVLSARPVSPTVVEATCPLR